MRHGWTAFRLRVFVSPVRDAPDNSLANTLPLARRIKAVGATLMLDLHYSDTWADPQHQEIPLAWRGLSFDSLVARVESYSRETIAAFKQAGPLPDWVQVGNEIGGVHPRSSRGKGRRQVGAVRPPVSAVGTPDSSPAP